MTYWLYGDVITWDYSWPTLALTCSNWYSWMCHRQINGLTDQWTGRPSYKVAKMHREGLIYLLRQYFSRKCWFPLFLTKPWPTNQPMDGATDGRSARPSHKDARTHLKMISVPSLYRIGEGIAWKMIKLARCEIYYCTKNYDNENNVRDGREIRNSSHFDILSQFASIWHNSHEGAEKYDSKAN